MSSSVNCPKCDTEMQAYVIWDPAWDSGKMIYDVRRAMICPGCGYPRGTVEGLRKVEEAKDAE